MDHRKPAEVTEEFRARLASVLLPLGFEVRARRATLVRKRGGATHRIELSSSHHNRPGDVTCWVTLRHEDRVVRAVSPGWVAGGGLGLAPFSNGDPLPKNVADSRDASALIALVLERLAFFDVMDDPQAVLGRVSVGYFPGLVDPILIVPYLRAHLGAGAVGAYASALLGGRPELWPAIAGHAAAPEQPDVFADHGTQLAGALSAAELAALEVPSDVVRSTERQAKALRSHFGLQLRAWGEPEAAAFLRRCDDRAIVSTRESVQGLPDSSVTSLDAARLVLSLACGEDRAPRRSAPEPRFYQYYAGHAPFAAVCV